MEFTVRRKLSVCALAAAAVCGVAVLSTTSALATGDPGQPVSPQVSAEGGAFDLKGREVPTRSYVGDTPPSDLGVLQGSGSATAGPQPISGTFAE